MDVADFWSKYEEFATDLVRPLSAKDQLAESEVAAAEECVGIRLPRLLREYYLRAGRLAEINESFNRLLPLFSRAPGNRRRRRGRGIRRTHGSRDSWSPC